MGGELGPLEASSDVSSSGRMTLKLIIPTLFTIAKNHGNNAMPNKMFNNPKEQPHEGNSAYGR